MVGKQLSISVINLAAPIASNRTTNNDNNNNNDNKNNASTNNESTNLSLLDQRKHSLSEENLSLTV